MTAAFDKLKKMLEDNKTLTNEAVEATVGELGAMTDEEKMWLEAEKLKLERQADATVTMEQYLEATQVLDSAKEGSDEYKKAQAVVDKFENGM